MLHEFVEFVEGRPSVALAALRRNAEAIGDDEGILHRALIERISPSGPGDSENCTQMRKIICHCLRRYLGDKLVGESNDILAADFGTVFVGDIVRLDRSQDLGLCPTNLFDRLIHIAVNDQGEWRILFFQSFKCARLGKFRLALLEPGRRCLLPLEGPPLAVNDLAAALNEKLGLI